MNTTHISILHYLDEHNNPALPRTPAGRALYTVDWFLHGRPELKYHDREASHVTGIFSSKNMV